MIAGVSAGNYYVAFGGTNCATHSVNLTTALISGCGRVNLVPCMLGTDCADCGRSASYVAALQDDDDAVASRRRAQALPALHDIHELHHLNRTLVTASSFHLPQPWLHALRITDHLSM